LTYFRSNSAFNTNSETNSVEFESLTRLQLLMLKEKNEIRTYFLLASSISYSFPLSSFPYLFPSVCASTTKRYFRTPSVN
jgi:hypothetical protein